MATPVVAVDKRASARLDRPRLNALSTSDKKWTGFIDPRTLIVLIQPRRTFRRISELANSMMLNKWIVPPEVAVVSSKDWPEYLMEINRLWDTRLQPGDFSPNYLLPQNGSEPYFVVLIAGERRTRACRYLCEKGCHQCQAAGLPIESGQCFNRHFPQGMPVTFNEVSVVQALNIQFTENTHFQLPLEEEADAQYRYLRFRRQNEPDLTNAEFARQIGRSEDWVRNSIYFSEAEPEIQDGVWKKQISYSIGQDLIRLQRVGGFSRAEVLDRMELYTAKLPQERPKTDEFRRLVTKLIVDRQSNQGSLNLMMSSGQEKASWRNQFRQTLAKSTRVALLACVTFLERLVEALDRREVGRVFASGSIQQVVGRFVGLLERINAHETRTLQRSLAQRLRREVTKHYAIREARRKLRIGQH